MRIWLRLLEELKNICKTEIRVQTFKLNPHQSTNAAKPILLTSMNKYFALAFPSDASRKGSHTFHALGEVLQIPKHSFNTKVG